MKLPNLIEIPTIQNAGNLTTDSGNRDWSNLPQALLSDDEQYTALSLTQNDHRPKTLMVRWDDIQLPKGSIITGFEVSITRRQNKNQDTKDRTVELGQNFHIFSHNKANPNKWRTEFETITYGGPNDLWGQESSQQFINDEFLLQNLQLRLRVQPESGKQSSVEYHVKYCELKVYCTTPSTILIPDGTEIRKEQVYLQTGTVSQIGGNRNWSMVYSEDWSKPNGNVGTLKLDSNNIVPQTISFKNFHQTFPSHTELTGVEVLIKRRQTQDSEQRDSVAQFYHGDTQIGHNKAKPEEWGKKVTLQRYGGPNDLWGLTVGDFIDKHGNFPNNLNFRLRQQPQTGKNEEVTMYIDYVQVIYHGESIIHKPKYKEGKVLIKINNEWIEKETFIKQNGSFEQLTYFDV